MNKKLIGVIVGIVLVLIILVSMQLYKHTEVPSNQSNAQQPPNITTSNQSNVQPSTNTISPKPAAGRHITVELNESLSVASH